jgi:hypothetical protein
MHTINTRFLGAKAFPSDGCRWKDLESSEQNSAYLFFGRCKASNAVKAHGLLATLQYYDEQGMLNLKFLHDWLTTRPTHALLASKQPQTKRLYVGGAEPEKEPDTNNDIDLSMFSNPVQIFSRINRELVSSARRSKNLPDFLERISLHRNDLLG